MELDIGHKEIHGSFLYELIRLNDPSKILIGWKLKALYGNTKKFKCDSEYEGYPVISLENKF